MKSKTLKISAAPVAISSLILLGACAESAGTGTSSNASGQNLYQFESLTGGQVTYLCADDVSRSEAEAAHAFVEVSLVNAVLSDLDEAALDAETERVAESLIGDYGCALVDYA